jgi:hypothetical protein
MPVWALAFIIIIIKQTNKNNLIKRIFLGIK